MIHSKSLFLKLFAVFFLGIGLGFSFERWLVHRHASDAFRPLRSPLSFRFINPLIGFDVSDDQLFPELQSLRNGFNAILHDSVAYDTVEKVSIYFRNLSNGHWLGINENEKFTPGSLLKVPIMIAYFKQSESQPGLLSKTLHYNPSALSREDDPQHPLASKLEKNKSYSIETLIRAMIVNSDNDAKDLLLANIDPRYVTEVFNDFGIQFPDDTEYSLSAKTFAFFFRRLHNATFLNREFSEKALQLLAETTFTRGLTAKLPESVRVAHKYGERGVYRGKILSGVELHDCGIIYDSSSPFFICVMTRGTDEAILENLIQRIAKFAYDEQL